MVNWNSYYEEMSFFIPCDAVFSMKCTLFNVNLYSLPLFGRQCMVEFTQFNNYVLLSSFQSISFTGTIDAATFNLHVVFKALLHLPLTFFFFFKWGYKR